MTLPTRLGVAFWATFFVLGVYLPFWPVWLESRGLAPELIGVALGLGAWARLIVNPLMGGFADRSGRTRAIAVALAAGVLVSYLLFIVAQGAVALLALSFLLGCTFAPLVPLIDATAVSAAARGAVDYGRSRRWGSAAFIVASVGVGWLLEGADESAILYVLIGGVAAMVLAMTLLPPRTQVRPSPSTTGVRAQLRRPHFRLFLLTCACLHGSHAVLYAYGTPHWRTAGIEESTIGWLWAEGVIAEIVLFSFAARIGKRVSGPGLMAIAGVGGLVRWPVLALTTSVPLLALGQLLHALTFAATHLGAMALIRQQVPSDETAGATALYSGVATGLAFGVGLPLAGFLYTAIGSAAYFVMAGVSALGLVAALILRRRPGLTNVG